MDLGSTPLRPCILNTSSYYFSFASHLCEVHTLLNARVLYPYLRIPSQSLRYWHVLAKPTIYFYSVYFSFSFIWNILFSNSITVKTKSRVYLWELDCFAARTSPPLVHSCSISHTSIRCTLESEPIKRGLSSTCSFTSASGCHTSREALVMNTFYPWCSGVVYQVVIGCIGMIDSKMDVDLFVWIKRVRYELDFLADSLIYWIWWPEVSSFFKRETWKTLLRDPVRTYVSYVKWVHRCVIWFEHC